MKRVLCCGILAASVVAGYVHWHGNQSVYSLTIVGGGSAGARWSYGPSWQIGTDPYTVGYEVRTGFPNDWSKKRNAQSFTDFHFGSHEMTVKGNMEPWLKRMSYVLSILGIFWMFWILTQPRAKPDTLCSDTGARAG